MSETGSSASEITRTYWIITGHDRKTIDKAWLQTVGNKGTGKLAGWSYKRSDALKFDAYYEAVQAYIDSATGIGRIVQVNVRKKPKVPTIPVPNIEVSSNCLLVNGKSIGMYSFVQAHNFAIEIKQALGIK